MWKLQMRQRDLDSSIISLQPGPAIAAHAGPDLDVLLLVLDGTGQLTTELGPLQLHPGALVWLPRRSRRGVPMTTASDTSQFTSAASPSSLRPAHPAVNA
ncbi:MAG: hypothetical protein ACRDND_29665 [Streptosporangiaceae bacterium]